MIAGRTDRGVPTALIALILAALLAAACVRAQGSRGAAELRIYPPLRLKMQACAALRDQ